MLEESLHQELTSLWPSHEELSRKGDRSISEACTSQAIELFVGQVIENDRKELTDSGSDYERGSSLENAVARYEVEFGKGSFSLSKFLPPGYRKLHGLDERKVRARFQLQNRLNSEKGAQRDERSK